MLEKLPELFPEMVEGVPWDDTEGGFRNVLDFLVSIRVAEFTKMLDDESLPLTHGVNWNELGRNYRCFPLQGVEFDIFDLLDSPTDDVCSLYSIIVTSFGTCRCTTLVTPTLFCQSC